MRSVVFDEVEIGALVILDGQRLHVLSETVGHSEITGSQSVGGPLQFAVKPHKLLALGKQKKYILTTSIS